jgi:hypothetical protein
MKKAMITIDVPASCKVCPLKTTNGTHKCCPISKKVISEKSKTRPDWCELEIVDIPDTPATKSKITIDTQSSCEWLYASDESWKDYVIENFDEIFVLTGNTRSHTCENAEWYKKVLNMYNDIDTMELDEMDASDYGITSEILAEAYKKIVEYYGEKRHNSKLDMIKYLAGLLYPNDTFEATSIHGYSQSDWQNVIYKSTNVDKTVVEKLSAFYFGKISEIIVETEDGTMVDVMIDDDLWEHERNDTLKSYLCETYELDQESTEFCKSSGIVQTTRYETF